MALIPYEALAVAPKSQEVSFIRTAQQQKDQAQQAQIVGTVQQQLLQKSTRTEKTSEKDETPFKFDAKEKGSNAYEQQKQKERKRREEEEAQERKKMLGCTFEISV